MKILLLQSSVYLPSYGGGNKANRLLLEALAARGHYCTAIAKSVDAQQVIDTTSEAEHLRRRGIQAALNDAHRLCYDYRGVTVHALKQQTLSDERLSGLRRYAEQWIHHHRPDVILVSDDKSGELLQAGLNALPERTVLVLHTNLHLPFGAEANSHDEARRQQIAACHHRLCSTSYTQDYLRRHAGLNSAYLPFPVFGEGPFASLASFDQGAIGLINPCGLKGIDIFLELARRLPSETFLAVPTWGADERDLQRLRAFPNVSIQQPADDIEVILRQLKVLLAPSLIAETFGYVVVEAMLRGIPVLASDYGGLRDATLGVGELLPIQPAVRQDGEWHLPIQDATLWEQHLRALLQRRQDYQQRSQQSWQAANEWVQAIDAAAFEPYLRQVAAC
ncbi:MAG: glycosyltransferase family 4 protein [Wenzhouxiangellaceae bacterium]